MLTGMSWDACLRFARAKGVEVLRLGPRLQLIPASLLLAAMRHAASTAPVVTPADELASMERMLAEDLRKPPTR
jgi:hypothetical protein